ncbi:hypothetical protein AMTRI_Chr12g234630 [Amborella trichopoda]|nr:uncharacterized protein LOC18433678 [Amborella trichopoda]XP_020522476.1 uncharacterized protein LOC18433678 [Amborella trichopoda]XP_020522477.1 uncharacterized protein LOC18433678 [Amborella trichopoda]|eukprot:XP_011623111.1 uncharacterized protein LOC18433678 [Amborella trichopoda]
MALMAVQGLSRIPNPANLNLLPSPTDPFSVRPLQRRCLWQPLKIEARGNTRTENHKVRNRRMQKKFIGSAHKPRLSVFCSEKQLYALLVDDQNKKCLFYGSTTQKSIRGIPSCSTKEAAERVGEELVKACIRQNINEISSFDPNGFARGQRMEAFEIAIRKHGFLPHGR